MDNETKCMSNVKKLIVVCRIGKNYLNIIFYFSSTKYFQIKSKICVHMNFSKVKSYKLV